MPNQTSRIVTDASVNFKAAFESFPGVHVLLLPDAPLYTIITTTDDHFSISGKSRDELAGLGIFEAFPPNPADPSFNGEENLSASFQYVIKNKQPHQLPVQRYDIQNENGVFEERYWSARNKPVLDEKGNVIYIIHSSVDITQETKAEKREEDIKDIEKAFDLFMQAPVIIGIVKGDDYIIELANEGMLKVWGRTKEVIGMPFLEAIPEMKGQGFIELLDEVRKTGKPYHAYESPSKLMRNGKEEVFYFDFIYQPYYEDVTNPVATGVIGVAHDVTEKVLARKKFEEVTERLNFRTALLEAQNEAVPDAILIVDTKGKMLSYNHHFATLWNIPQEIIDRKDDDAALKFAMTQVANPQEFIERVNYCYMHPDEKAYDEIDFIDGRIIERHGNAVVGEDGKRYGWVWHFRDVTEAKQLQNALQESEETFRNLANSVPQLVWMAHADGKVFYYNDRIYEYGGHKNENGVWEWDLLLHPDDLEETATAWDRAVATGNMYIAEHRVQMNSGEFRWHLSRGFPEKNASGTIIKWVGTATDIHEQKLAEETIKERERRFRILAETLPQMVWMRNSDGEMEYFSKNWEEYSGISNAREAWRAMVHPDDWHTTMKTWETDYATGHPFRHEVRLKNKEGEYRWHSAVGEPVKDEEGNVTKWIGALTDIHVQKTFSEKLEKKVEERTKELQAKNNELENTRSFLQQLIDSSIEFISVLDNDLNYLAVNKRFEEVLGIPREKIIGKNLFELNAAAKDTIQHQSIIKAFRGEATYLDKRPSIAKPDYYVDTHIIPLTLQNEVRGVIVLSRDVTDIVKSEKLLEQKNRELERSNEDLQQFAHVASHDLKEPIRKVKTFGSRIHMEFADLLPERGKTYLYKLENAAERMYQMIDGILQYSTFSSLDLPAETVDINELIKQIESDLEIIIQEKGATIQTSNLATVKGSPVLLQQLFYNLINNSLKFSKEAERPIIKIYAEAIDRKEQEMHNLPTGRIYTKIVVEDNGIGFNQRNAEKIFQSFFRLNSKDKYEGTGLGLALCRKIVERQSGIIIAEGQENIGARFILFLPVE